MDPSALMGVTITSREIYDAVVRLTGRVDVLIEQQAHTNTDVQDHEGRIRVLEKGRWPLPALSALVAIGALTVSVLPYITK